MPTLFLRTFISSLVALVAVASGSVSAQEAPPTAPAIAGEEELVATCTRDGTDDIASYAMTKGENIPLEIKISLTGKAGNARAGQELMIRPDRGNCTTCHAVKAIKKEATTEDTSSIARLGLQGTVGPSLDGVAKRYTVGELRLIVVNPQAALPQSNPVMPAYHHVKDLIRVKAECADRAILTAQEVEDVVSYLTTLVDEP